MKKIAIFGSTGSVGESTLNVIRENLDLFQVITLVAGRNIEKLIEQIEEFKPKNVYIIEKENADRLKQKYNNLNIYYGEKGMEEISKLTDFDISISALVGIAGLKPTYNMIKNGKTVALANKEVLVAGGELIMKTARESKAKLVTVDSEHSAIMQCLNGEENNKIDKILLTASGGPFFDKEIGFEVIEAKWLFNVDPKQIEVVVHRKSLVHSMVQFLDGTIMANIGPKSMQIPIAYALNCPKRLKNNIEKLDLFEITDLKFEKPKMKKFKCLQLAYKAIEKGHSYQVVLNAANEVLVDKFLNKKIKYTDIANGIEKVMNSYEKRELKTIDEILEFDKEVRTKTEEMYK